MADLNRVRDPLELAAASPDPVVRRMAIRRKEIEPEIARLDSFFAIYAEQPDAKTPQKVVTPAPKTAPVSRGTRKRGEVKPDVFGDILCRILTVEGPLNRQELYEHYRQAAPNDTTRTIESLRVAISKRSALIGRVSASDKRYWPVGVPLPAEINGASTVA